MKPPNQRYYGGPQCAGKASAGCLAMLCYAGVVVVGIGRHGWHQVFAGLFLRHHLGNLWCRKRYYSSHHLIHALFDRSLYLSGPAGGRAVLYALLADARMYDGVASVLENIC